MIDHSLVARARRVTLLGTALLIAFSSLGLAQTAEESLVLKGPESIVRVTPIRLDVDVRDLPAPREWRPGDPIREIPKRRYLPPGVAPRDIEERVDALGQLQQSYTSSAPAMRGQGDSFPVPTRNILGIGFTGAGVPDTVGDVGLNHFVQSVNGGTRVQIYDKSLPNPNLLASFNLDAFGAGSCATGGGDPVVIYDREADRWVIMEFPAFGVSSLCVYVSQTPDPVSGGWFFYEFDVPSFPDYEKFGSWPTDANGGDGSYVTTANAGNAVYALERGPMLTGAPAGQIQFNLPGLSAFAFQTTTPADIDGPDQPEPGAEAIIMRQRDGEAHGGPGGANFDALEMWYLDVNWQQTGLTTISQQPSILVEDFSSELCGFVDFACFAQPSSGTTLDPLREVIMHRLQYINHASEGYETLVGNFVTDVNGNDRGGVRWFELRRTGGPSAPWELFQEGTYTIDSDNRFMGMSSMDQSGNIALAYNVSSTSTFPSLRYTGRRFDDPLGVMTQPETTIGAGSNPSPTNRYGDYNAMGLDPADDCTFWATGMYNPAGTWRTRIASFRFEQCGCLVAPSPIVPIVEATEFNVVEVNWDDADLESVVSYDVRRARSADGPFEVIATVQDSSEGIAGGPGYTFTDTEVNGGIVYFYDIVASDGGACRSDSATSQVEAFGQCALRPVFDGVDLARISLSDTCGIFVEWSAGAAECGDDVLYNLYRSTDSEFEPGPATLVSGGINGTSALDQNDLIGGTEYFYVVRALDPFNRREDLNTIKASATAGGSGGQEDFYAFDFEDVAEFNSDWTVSTGPGLHRCGEFEISDAATQRPGLGTGNYALALSEDCTTILPATSTSLDSPSFDLTDPSLTAVIVEFDINYDHLNGDDATVEVWDGAQWVVIWTDPNADVDERLSFDVSAEALGNPGFQVRFNYQNANDDRWYAVDNFRIGVDLSCDTAPAPLSVPNGLLGTSPILGQRLSDDGSSLRVTWDTTTCSANEYNLLAGSLTDVSTYTFSTTACDISAGSFDWNTVPAGSTFFLLVGADGAGTESSWGTSTFGERQGLTPSGECGATQKVVAATCSVE